MGAGDAVVTSYRIVTPYRAFAPESEQHLALPAFDWLSALRMVSHTARLSNGVPVTVLTDTTTQVPIASLRYDTTHQRLTLWLLEIRLRYLSSPDFDRDTVTVDADELIFGDLSPWFQTKAGMTVIIRTEDKHMQPGGWPLLNGVQWWKVRRKAALVSFYERALRLAEQMPEDRIKWGSETDAVRHLLDPLVYGQHKRAGLRVDMVPVEQVVETFSSGHIQRLGAPDFPKPTRPILDFRWTRKQHMRAAYDALVLEGAA
jgi:hypothetical protein